MINFCTLFDSNYLAYGLSMYQSLQKNCPNFHLYIFAFDEKVESDLAQMQLSNVTIIKLRDFEDEKLLKIKPSRTAGEYCWTCTPSVILYVLKNFKVPNCTYVDADLYFFSDPQILLDELNEKSVSIIEHRYTPQYDQTKTSGKYCVQFMTFKNDSKGLNVLNWWREKCIEWCFAQQIDNKFGDQKYLDDWMTRFDCVVELQNIGGGVAPWNVQQYDFVRKNKKIWGIEKSSGKAFLLIFYHFHGFKILNKKQVRITNCYEISANVRNLIYSPYLQNMLSHKICCETYQKKCLISFVLRRLFWFKQHDKSNIISMNIV